MKTKETATKIKEIEEFFNNSGLLYIPITYYGNNGFFISIDNINNKKSLQGIHITMCNKDCCRIYPHEILYVAIENRKSVLYLTNGRVETNYRIGHWRSILDEKNFAQPHYSYIVNLNYVVKVTKNFVNIKFGNEEHFVYTSSRKLSSFKKAFLNFKE